MAKRYRHPGCGTQNRLCFTQKALSRPNLKVENSPGQSCPPWPGAGCPLTSSKGRKGSWERAGSIRVSLGMVQASNRSSRRARPSRPPRAADTDLFWCQDRHHSLPRVWKNSLRPSARKCLQKSTDVALALAPPALPPVALAACKLVTSRERKSHLAVLILAALCLTGRISWLDL